MDTISNQLIFKDATKPITHLLSIDPGLTNLGWTFYEYQADIEGKHGSITATILKGNAEVLVDNDCTIENVTRSVRSWYLKNFTPEDRSLCQVVLEHQYVSPRGPNVFRGVQLHTVQTALYAVAETAFNMPSFFISPSVYKRQFGLLNDDSKKSKAIRFARSLLPAEDTEFVRNQHMADSINQAYYHLKNAHEEAFHKPFHVVFKLKK